MATSTLEEIRSSGTLRVLPWHDAVVEALGHDPRSYYVERFWLPVLGPSTIFLLRLLAVALEASPGGCELDLSETARRLGLSERAGPHAPVVRTLTRCVDFEMARPGGFATLAFRRRLPPLARRQLARLTESLLDEHARWAAAATVRRAQLPPAARLGDATAGRRQPLDPRPVGAGARAGVTSHAAVAPVDHAATVTLPPGSPPVSVLRERGRRLALSLLQLGEDRAAAEHQLVRWHYHPSLAGECAAWAAAVHRDAARTTDPAGAAR